MNHKQWYFAGLVLLGYVLLLTGCDGPTNPSGDTTPPGFVQVLVQLEGPTSPNPRGEFDVTSQDVARDQIGSDLIIRVLATASDSESGIRDIATISELSWRCAFGPNSETIGIFETATLPFVPDVPPSTPTSSLPTLWQINVVADPISTTGCSTAQPGEGPIFISGYVRVMATNGLGLTATSKTFIFDYADVGSN